MTSVTFMQGAKNRLLPQDFVNASPMIQGIDFLFELLNIVVYNVIDIVI